MELKVVRWAAEECERQQTGPIAVYNMLSAWSAATGMSFLAAITLDHVRELGELVEPEKNKGGRYRSVPVSFRNHGNSTDPMVISHAMETLLKYQPGRDNIDLDYWYKEFEYCHPFIDGNGRVGSILYNLFNGSLWNPVIPPDMWE